MFFLFVFGYSYSAGNLYNLWVALTGVHSTTAIHIMSVSSNLKVNRVSLLRMGLFSKAVKPVHGDKAMLQQ